MEVEICLKYFVEEKKKSKYKRKCLFFGIEKYKKDIDEIVNNGFVLEL